MFLTAEPALHSLFGTLLAAVIIFFHFVVAVLGSNPELGPARQLLCHWATSWHLGFAGTCSSGF